MRWRFGIFTAGSANWLNGGVCDGPAANDNIGNILWKKGVEIINLLDKKDFEFDSDFFKKSICADGEHDEEMKQKGKDFLNVRTKLYDFALAVTRVKPFQDRMVKIYSFEYGVENDAEKPESETNLEPVIENAKNNENSEIDQDYV